jgi:TldD protein
MRMGRQYSSCDVAPACQRQMSVTRREFVRDSALAVASLTAVRPGERFVSPLTSLQRDSSRRQLCMVALDAARGDGATYADARVTEAREQGVYTREQRVVSLNDAESLGMGVRVRVAGAWGFAASSRVTADEAARLARVAVAQARANAIGADDGADLAETDPVPDGRWQSPSQTDPFDVPVEEKIELLLGANGEALRVSGVRFVTSSIACVRLQTTFASTLGSLIEQTLVRTWPSMTVTAVADDGSDYQSRSSSEIPPMGLGYEHVSQSAFAGRAGTWAEQAVAKLHAPAVVPGEYDLVLTPSNLFLTIHESIGHPTELDRALGYEADYAGTSFLAPPQAVLGSFRYGPEIMNVQADRTQRGGLATIGWDDDGVPADSWPLVRDGVFVDYQTTRTLAGAIAPITGFDRSHGCATASGWDRIQFQRMPNVSLLPGVEDLTLDDLVAATDRGILIDGAGSYSIDQQRYDFQFGGQVCYEIRNGAIAGMLKDVAYQGRTPEFWNSLDLLGGPRSYALGGTFYDGKGQPSQSNAVSHGCPPARFHDVSIINTSGAGS